ncbi:MAG: AI-2E family transporter [Chloroflexi bacterium]|nr:AI-2E family transporter [Chloroflexota bacterium]
MAAESTAFNKYWKPILILLGAALVIWLAWKAMAVLIPFLVGILLAYLLMPLVTWLEKILPPKGKAKKSKRAIAVIIVFIVFTVVLVLFIVYIGAAIVTASGALTEKAPEFVTKSMAQASEWLDSIMGKLSPDIVDKARSALADAGPAVGKFLQDFVVGSVAVIPASMPTVMGFITLPFFLIFVLIGYENYGKYFNEILPANVARHTNKILTIFGDQMGRYIRFQIILATVAGFLVFIGLFILGEEYAPAMGAITAFTQVIPIIGPFISAAIILVITLALKPDMILGAILVIVVAQVIVNLIAGWVQEKHFPLDPAVVMILMTVGGYVGSYWGIIFALPVGATVWGIYKYFRSEQKAEKIKIDSP